MIPSGMPVSNKNPEKYARSTFGPLAPMHTEQASASEGNRRIAAPNTRKNRNWVQIFVAATRVSGAFLWLLQHTLLRESRECVLMMRIIAAIPIPKLFGRPDEPPLQTNSGPYPNQPR